MGAADVVPGVSGGTIAFITGIYEELLSSIAQINMEAYRVLRQSGWKAFWERINGTFFLFLFAGVGISIVSLAHLIQKLLTDYPIPTWSFFFGLIMASVAVVYQRIKKPGLPQVWAALALGAIVAYFITLATPAAGTDNLFYLFFSGSIAIVAMILPGISGSFILLLLGVYLTVMETISQFTGAIKNMDSAALVGSGSKLIVFALGCAVGLMLFARALKWLFQKAHDLTIAVLTGFLIGSLNKVWPWKKVVSTFVKYEGTPREKVVPLVERNVWPGQFTHLTDNDNQLIFAGLAAFAGLALVLILNRYSPKKA
ncbi:MAG: DUF368 domain-containing protein [Cryomorphaceae bacterium]|nr:MAG: DUF368 domain-containing protein [Cryomorphaceae bacterium]